MDLQELSNWPEYIKILFGVFAVVSPPVYMPIFIGLMNGRTAAEKKKAALVGAAGFFVTAALFTLFGNVVLAAFSITLPTFRLAGGFLLLLIALDMLRADSKPPQSVDTNQGASAIALAIVPLSIPILAGPGVMSAVVLFSASQDSWSHRLLIVLVLLIVSVCIYVLLRMGGSADRFFTPSVTRIFNKIMGLLVCAIAFEFMMDGIAGHFPFLTTIHQTTGG